MTRTSIFLFHPNLDQSTVNLRLAQAAEGQEGVQIRDLYGLYPDFEIDVNAEQDILEASDRIVLQFPMYWYSCPPLLRSGRTTSSPTAGPTGPTATPCTAKNCS